MHEYLITLNIHTHYVSIVRAIDGMSYGAHTDITVYDMMRVFSYLVRHNARYLYTDTHCLVFSLKKG